MLNARVTRFRYQYGDADAYSAQRLNDISQFLRQRGVQVTLNSVIPLGPVGKALAGPEPSAGRRPWTGGPEGEVVAVIDTGISYEQRTDQWLQDPPVVRDGTNEDNLTDIDLTHLNFAAGHGQLVTGIIQQVEPGARIKMHKTLDGDGFGSDVAVAAAMVRAVRGGARILNLSLGTRTPDDQPPIGMQTALEIIREETGDETVIVAAAGNYANTILLLPGLVPSGRLGGGADRGRPGLDLVDPGAGHDRLHDQRRRALDLRAGRGVLAGRLGPRHLRPRLLGDRQRHLVRGPPGRRGDRPHLPRAGQDPPGGARHPARVRPADPGLRSRPADPPRHLGDPSYQAGGPSYPVRIGAGASTRSA